LKADLIQAEGGPADESVSHATIVNFPKRTRPRPNLKRASVLAGAAILVFAGVFMIAHGYWPFRWQSEPWQMYSTASAQHREVTLADESVITLGGDTVLRVRVAAHSRAAILDRGEALFRVKHDTQQPFTVHARNGSIEAIGTVFDVRDYSNRVEVTVTEGLVEVVSRASQVRDVPIDNSWFGTAEKSASVRVRQGQRVSYRMDGSAGAPQVADLVQATDWTRGSITYNGKPLHEIIEDVQRYYSRRIVLDPAIADLTYSGTFRQKDAGSWLRNLQLIFPVEVLEQDSNSVVIRARR
jgi:transmembrane sensor